MSNRTLHFITSILQNSKINRTNFIKNKKIYNEKIYENKQHNHNLIMKRKFSSFQPLMNGGGGGDGNEIIYLTAIIVGLYFTFKK
jgi:hypothetical protein